MRMQCPHALKSHLPGPTDPALGKHYESDKPSHSCVSSIAGPEATAPPQFFSMIRPTTLPARSLSIRSGRGNYGAGLHPVMPSGYDLRPHIPVFGGRFPVQREGIELVGEEDFGKSLIARAKADTRARRQVDP